MPVTSSLTATGDTSLTPVTTSLSATDNTSLTPVTSSLTCPSCQSEFETMSSLVAHVTQSHGRRSTVRHRPATISSQRPYRCYRCWKTFTVQSKLQHHMLSHAENLKDFKCDVSIQWFMVNLSRCQLADRKSNRRRENSHTVAIVANFSVFP